VSGGEIVGTSGGSRIYVERAGDGPPVVALHGIGGGTYFFRGLATRLYSAARVIAIDLPGTGRSDAPRPLLFEHWIADISELIASEIGGPVVIIGHSLGTILALELWRSMRESIRGMVFVGGLPVVRNVVRERLTERAAAIRARGIAGWGCSIAAANFGSRAFADRPEAVVMFERLIETIDGPSYVRTIELLLDADATAVVPTVTVPCLSISGSEDKYAPPDAVAAFIGRLGGPARSIVLPRVGHLPFFEAPEEFASLVSEFLRTIST
jgi:3-oxoadipate enol-lactonase